MRKPDETLARALTNLRASEDFQDVRDYLQLCLADRDKANRRAQGEALLQGQGESLFLEKFIEAIDQAPVLMEKFRANRKASG